MTQGEAFQTALEEIRDKYLKDDEYEELSIIPITRTELIGFAEKEGLLNGIGCVRNGKRTSQ